MLKAAHNRTRRLKDAVLVVAQPVVMGTPERFSRWLWSAVLARTGTISGTATTRIFVAGETGRN